jgi:F0F1-type ATP synthase assembly protein I
MSQRGKNNPKYDKSVFRAAVLITQFGINMLVPICMMSALGIWLDGRFQTSYWTVLLFFVGAIAGAQNIYRMARKIYEADDEKEQGAVHEDSGDAKKSK